MKTPERKAWDRAWYLRNRDITIARARARAVRLGEAMREYMGAYYHKHRQKLIHRAASWRVNNLERGREINRLASVRRRTKKHGLIHNLSEQEWLHILEYFGHRCAYCFQKSPPYHSRSGTHHKLAMDHVVPVASGGHTVPDNIVPACQSCNASKSDLPLLVALAKNGVGISKGGDSLFV